MRGLASFFIAAAWLGGETGLGGTRRTDDRAAADMITVTMDKGRGEGRGFPCLPGRTSAEPEADVTGKVKTSVALLL